MADKVSTKSQKSNKPGFFARLGKKLKGLKSEFKKIKWANLKTTTKSFGVALVGLLAFGIVIGLVDLGLGSFFKFLLSL